MKKLLILCAALLLSAGVLQAQKFGKGTQTIKLGVGINNFSVPVMAEYELGIVDNLATVSGLGLGVGGYAGFYHHKLHGRNNNFYVGTQGLAHYMPVSNLDVYVGAMIGARFRTGKHSGDDKNVLEEASRVLPTITPVAGGRYQLTPGFGVYANLAIDHGVYFACAGIAFEF